jgi:hypothetical protein
MKTPAPLWLLGLGFLAQTAASLTAHAAPKDDKVLCQLIDVAASNPDESARQKAWKSATTQDPSILGTVRYEIARENSKDDSYRMNLFLQVGGKEVAIDSIEDSQRNNYAGMLQAIQGKFGNIRQNIDASSFERLLQAQKEAAPTRPAQIAAASTATSDRIFAKMYGALYDSLKARQTDCVSKGHLKADRVPGNTEAMNRLSKSDELQCLWAGVPSIIQKDTGRGSASSSCRKTPTFCAGMMSCKTKIGNASLRNSRIVTCEAIEQDGKYHCGNPNECFSTQGRGNVIFKKAEATSAPGSTTGGSSGGFGPRDAGGAR